MLLLCYPILYVQNTKQTAMLSKKYSVIQILLLLEVDDTSYCNFSAARD